MMKAVRESCPEVGSSRMISLGLLINSKAMDVLFFSPPDIPFSDFSPPMIVSRHFSSLRSEASLLTVSDLEVLEAFKRRAATYYNVSLTVRVGKRLSSCIM